MENQLKLKKSKIRLLYITILVLIGFIILYIALLFFSSIPKTVKEIAKNRKVERCVYAFGIAYSIPPAFDDDFDSLVDSSGNSLCIYGGVGGLDANGSCKTKMCFSVYDS